MGLHKSYSETVYWNQKPEQGPIHTVSSHMSLKLYQAIKRYLHISNTLTTNFWELESPEN